MSDETDDRASAYLSAIKNHPWVAVCIVAGTLIVGLATFTATVTSAVATVQRIFFPYDHPQLLQFTIDLSSSPFRETSEPKFGAGPPITTFAMDPSFLGVVRTGRAVFQVSLENPNDVDLVVTDVIYTIRELGEVRGGVAGPLESKHAYFHELTYATGEQRHQLVPPFRIPPRSAGAFTIDLYTKDPRPGLTWVMNAEFVTNAGPVATADFQLVLSGKGAG